MAAHHHTRSRFLTLEELPSTIKNLKRFWVAKEGATVPSPSELQSLHVLSNSLPPLNALIIPSTLVSEHAEPDWSSVFGDCTKAIQKDVEKCKKCFVSWECWDVDKPLKRNTPCMVVSAGWKNVPEWRVGGYYCGIGLWGGSPGLADKRYRRDFFQRAFECMGAIKEVTVDLDNDVLLIHAKPPYRLTYPSAEFGGKNANEVDLVGFASLDEAMGAAQQIVQHLARRTIQVRFVMNATAEVYVVSRDALSQAAQHWRVEAFSRMTQTAYEFLESGEMKPDIPERIPFLSWMEDQKPFGINYYSAEVVGIAEGHCVEIASDCGDTKALNVRANMVEGLDFREVSLGS